MAISDRMPPQFWSGQRNPASVVAEKGCSEVNRQAKSGTDPQTGPPAPPREFQKAVPELNAQRGSALLAVLWVSAALAAIAFSLSNTVLGETGRTSTAMDGLRSQYLAEGGIWRATDELLWSVQNFNPTQVNGGSKPGMASKTAPFLDYSFPSGVVQVEIVPETAKLDVNFAPTEQLYRLLAALGQNPSRAGELAGAIAGYRSTAGPGAPANAAPSFPGGPASFQEIEDLLLVPGVTPEIYYGTYITADAEGEVPLTTLAPGVRLIPRPGLEDCLSVFGSRNGVDINTAQPAVLAAIGVPADAINAIVARRRTSPITPDQVPLFLQTIGIATAPLRSGGNSIYTIRATARLRLPNGQLSDMRRTVAAQIKYMPPGYDAPIHVLRWYDTAWKN